MRHVETIAVRERIKELAHWIEALLEHEPSSQLVKTLDSARDDLSRIELSIADIELGVSALCIPESKVWRVAKVLELYGPNAQLVPDDLREFEIAGRLNLRAPREQQ